MTRAIALSTLAEENLAFFRELAPVFDVPTTLSPTNTAPQSTIDCRRRVTSKEYTNELWFGGQ